MSAELLFWLGWTGAMLLTGYELGRWVSERSWKRTVAFYRRLSGRL